MFPSHWSYHISIAVAFNFATLITFFAAHIPPRSPFRFIMIYPDLVVMNIMACRVFRNVKFGRHSQVLIMPTPINTGNPTQHDHIPGKGGENSYHMDDTVTIPMSAEVSRWKELVTLPIPESHRRGMERPNTHLIGVEVTKVVEHTRSWRREWRYVVAIEIRAFLTSTLTILPVDWKIVQINKRSSIYRNETYIRRACIWLTPVLPFPSWFISENLVCYF